MEKQDLPVVDILFEKIKAKDIPFNPVNFIKITIVKNTSNY